MVLGLSFNPFFFNSFTTSTTGKLMFAIMCCFNCVAANSVTTVVESLFHLRAIQYCPTKFLFKKKKKLNTDWFGFVSIIYYFYGANGVRLSMTLKCLTLYAGFYTLNTKKHTSGAGLQTIGS